MVIGLTGPNASGKGEVASYLASKGFTYHSLSDVVREEAAARGLDPSRENLIRMGNELRARDGPSILASRIRKQLIGKDVVDSIRNPFEVMELRKEKGFVLIAVDAPVELRFERSCRRGRTGDGLKLDEFVRKEQMENSADPGKQQLLECLGLADHLIINDGSLDELHRKVDDILSKYSAR